MQATRQSLPIYTNRWLTLILALTLAACGGGGGSRGGTDSGGGTGSDLGPEPGYVAPPDRGDGWAVGPADADPELLEAALAALRSGEFPQVDAVVIAQGGKLVLEEQLPRELDRFDREVGNTDPAMHAQFSASKSLASVLVGVAIEQGYLQDVSVPYQSLFDYPPPANDHPWKQAITLEDVLTMRAGLAWNEWDPPYDHPDNQLWRFHANHHDWSRGLLDLPMAAQPGTVFAYNTVASTSLGQAVANAAPLALVDFAGEYLLEPLGISDILAFETPTALPDVGRGLFLRTRDMARFGQLMLDDGHWQGQRLLPEGWVEAATHPHVEIGRLDPENWDFQIRGYGYQWWIGDFEVAGQRIDCYAASGNGQQFTAVFPELSLVISVNARVYDERSQDPNQVFALVRHRLLPAFMAAGE